MPPARNKRSRENDGLPKRWRFKHGAYFYRVPAGLERLWDGKKEFRLGTSRAEAHAEFAKRIGCYEGELRLMEQLFERVLLEHVPTLAPKSRTMYQDCLKRLTVAFEGNPIWAIETTHCYQYKDAAVKAHSPFIAKHDLQVLSLAFSKAIEWGARKDHPIIGKGFKKPSTRQRDRYVEDWEIIECLALRPRRKRGSVLMVQAYIRIKLLTGLRRADMLALNVSTNIKKGDGIHIQPSKTKKSTGKKIIINWTSDLEQAIEIAKAARPLDVGPWLFCNRSGEPYAKEDGTANGFDSIWQRFMARVLKETKVTESFTERDLRAKCASDMESLEKARALLAHADSRITNTVYRRKPERVQPGKFVGQK